MICLIGKQETRRRHGGEELDDLRASGRGDVLDVRCDVSKDYEECRVDSVEISLASGHKGVN